MPKDNYDLPIPKFGSNATKFPPNVFGTQTPLDLTDPQYLKNIVSNGNYAKGQEGNATADGLYARSDIENENAKILFINGFLADRIFPRGLFAYSSTAEYYQHSPTFEISTGKIFQSLQDSNIGKPLTDTAWWLDTGQTIQTLYTNITQQANALGDIKHSIQSVDHNNWLLCDGREISRITYANLFTLIGESFGIGDGASTFNLPNAKGRVLGASGQGAGLTNRNTGEMVGDETHTLTEAELPQFSITTPLQQSDTDRGSDSSLWSIDNIATTTIGQNQSHNNMQPTLFIGNVFIYAGV